MTKGVGVSSGSYIDIDIFVNCNWVVTRWQYTFTQKQYIEQYKTTILEVSTLLWLIAADSNYLVLRE